MTKEEVEAVARAFYEIQEAARGWVHEPEVLKEQFRKQARIAIAALEEHEAEARAKVGSLIVPGHLEAARSYLMEAEEVSILPGSSFRAILRGPEHTFDAANQFYSKLVGHRDVANMPVRAALPELAGQGYYELLDQVYSTRQTFIGHMLPIRLQVSPDRALEDHKIDLVYRPIEDLRGKVIGLFVEGSDRTERARA